MTDQHLSDLLHADADRIAVPPAPATAVIAEGRRLRWRTRAARGGALVTGVAAVAAAATFAVVLPRSASTGPDHLAAAVAPDPAGWAVAQGSTVHLGNGRTVDVPGKVKAMYYTSAGVMVRTGRTAF